MLNVPAKTLNPEEEDNTGEEAVWLPEGNSAGGGEGCCNGVLGSSLVSPTWASDEAQTPILLYANDYTYGIDVKR